MGTIIGKYGTDILLIGSSAKAIKAYRDLRKANNAMTLENMTKALKKDKLMECSQIWKEKTQVQIKKTTSDLTGRGLYKKLRHITDENQLRIALHKHGIQTFERPKGIPKDWKVKITEKSGGMKYLKNEQTYVRVMPGNPKSPNPAQRKPYVIYMKNGKTLDNFEHIVLDTSFEAHIDFNKFIFRD